LASPNLVVIVLLLSSQKQGRLQTKCFGAQM
jgi:hypothetical protein